MVSKMLWSQSLTLTSILSSLSFRRGSAVAFRVDSQSEISMMGSMVVFPQNPPIWLLPEYPLKIGDQICSLIGLVWSP